MREQFECGCFIERLCKQSYYTMKMETKNCEKLANDMFEIMNQLYSKRIAVVNDDLTERYRVLLSFAMDEVVLSKEADYGLQELDRRLKVAQDNKEEK